MNNLMARVMDSICWLFLRDIIDSEERDRLLKATEKQFAKDNKPKVKLYCKNPECFNHYLANNKIKDAEDNVSVQEGEQ